MYTNIVKIDLPKVLTEILTDLKSLNARPILLGGCVRDAFLNLCVKDYDIEIFGINSLEDIKKTLEKYANVNLVGKSFGVLKLKIDDFDFDFSLPRIEKKIGHKHIDFEVITDANISFEQAARRRDFTINAIGYDYFEDEFLDPFNGIKDLENKVLKHIDDETFVEDSLRVYRAVQFASRFDFKIDLKTIYLCKEIVNNNELEFLPKERVFEELKKLFLKSKKPSIGLRYLKEFGLFKYFPELNNIDFEKNLIYIDNLQEVLKAKESAKNIDDFKKLYLFYTILCKKLEKEEAHSFLKKLSNDKKFVENILILNENELILNVKQIKRLSLKLEIEDLIFLNFAFKNPISQKVFEIAENLNILNKPIKKLVQGKDLIKISISPSQKFKEILELAFDLQVDKDLKKEQIIKEIKIIYKKDFSLSLNTKEIE